MIGARGDLVPGVVVEGIAGAGAGAEGGPGAGAGVTGEGPGAGAGEGAAAGGGGVPVLPGQGGATAEAGEVGAETGDRTGIGPGPEILSPADPEANPEAEAERSCC